MEKNYLTNAMNLGKELCIKKVKNGDVVVDATMGNGNDTLFLSKLVGDNGKVYAFDIQKEAIKNTRKRLKEEGVLDRVNLIEDGHENMDKYILDKVDLVMFNLGYLPKGEHEITTKAETTLKAIKKSLKILKKNGILIVIIYHGHKNGKEEKIAIENYSKELNQKEYNVIDLSFINEVNNPPVLLAIEKR